MASRYECSKCLHVQVVGIIPNGLSGLADPRVKCEGCGERGTFFHAPGWQRTMLKRPIGFQNPRTP